MKDIPVLPFEIQSHLQDYRFELYKYGREELLPLTTDYYVKYLDFVFPKIADLDLRTLIIVGTAHIDELLKDCFQNTIVPERKKSLPSLADCAKYLWGQGYLSDDTFELIEFLRNTRNHYAHSFTINPDKKKLINQKKGLIMKKFDGKWSEHFSKNQDFWAAYEDDKKPYLKF